MWFITAILNPILHGAANILDNYISNKSFKNISTLIFYSALFDLIFLPIIFLLFGLPEIPKVEMIPFFLIVGLANILYLYPYYKALQSDDTSTVSSLFSLGKIFVPVLAFIIVGEIINVAQYIGFFIIIISSTLLTLNNFKQLKFNRSFLYMLICSLILSIEVVVYKYIFNSVDWVTGLTFASLASFFIIILTAFIPMRRRDIAKEFPLFKKIALLFGAEELLTFSGSASITYALSLAPVTVVEAIGSSQPFFVLIYALIFGRLFPKLFKEKVDSKNIAKKILLFTIMIVGVILVILNE